MTRNEMLDQLQPPGMPLEPGFWPPATIWWLLSAFICLLGIYWLLWRRHQQLNRHYFQARQSLDHISQSYSRHGNSRQLLQQLAYWLRQVGRIIDTGGEPGRLHGKAWLDFLDRDLKQPGFSSGPGTVFADQLYRASTAS